MIEKFQKVTAAGWLAVVAPLTFLSACSSASGTASSTDTNSAGPSVTAATPNSTPSSAPATPATATLAYDTSVGVGVDANGYANLPLRSGAHRYFVNSASGSVGNGCSAAQQAATPMATMAAAVACVQAGNGDQVLVAEGTRYSEPLPNLDHAAGYDPQYPTVIQSYDPSDPSNEAKYGRASNGRRPVVNTGANPQPITCCAALPASYLAIRGFDINPGNVPDQGIGFAGSNGLSNSYILIENNILRYTMLGIQDVDRTKAVGMVIRKNSFYGEWSAAAHAQGAYLGKITFTAEDNVFWHTGWKLGASRDDATSAGGATIFRHSIYQQDDADGTVRRNIFIDPSATGCSCRGNTVVSENVFIDNPISIIGGEGVDYNTTQPNGVNVDIGYNAILGDADINTGNPRGAAIQTGNGTKGSAVHHNLILRSRNPSGMNVSAFNTQSNFQQPSYIDIHDNLEYLWVVPGYVSIKTGTFPGQNFPTYENNAWSDPASGTNVNSAGMTFPNPYTEAQLFAALGCTDKATCTARMVETPELGWAVKARTLLWQGYGR